MVNLQPLFQMQKVLDAKIVKQKGLEGVDLLDKKVLALLTELGELVNELPEVFKFWSNKKNDYEKALKEYVDCLHFALSIALENKSDFMIRWDTDPGTSYMRSENITEQFRIVFDYISEMPNSRSIIHDDVQDVFTVLAVLGEMLGFTWDQIEQAYMDKNEENHARQANGY